ncbi:MAG: hypothetical protein KAX46_01090, partial [Chromatiaceae bacterium]|nr:hypothetical protein [Chromatiaceae bacterium]
MVIGADGRPQAGRPRAGSYGVGDWVCHTQHSTPCRIVEHQAIWGETVFRVWLPTKEAIVRARGSDLAPLSGLRLTT